VERVLTKPWIQAGRWAVLVASLSYLTVYLFIAVSRIAHPYELEWLEGGSVDHVLRVMSGEPLYAEPSLEFVSFIYTPLYFYVSAAAAWLVGIGFFPLRLVSFLASIGAFSVLFLLVRRETGSWFWGVVSTGLYAATFRVCGAMMDSARVDSLFMLFVLLAILALRSWPTVPGSLIAALLMSAAFMTKQTALFIAIPLGLYCLVVRKGWTRFAFAGGFGMFVLVSTLVFDLLTDDWYSFYVFELPGRHAIVWSLTPVFLRDALAPVWLALLVSLFFLAHALWQRLVDVALFYALVFAGLVGAGFLSRLQWGGYDNVFLPAEAGIAILFGLGGHAVRERLSTDSARAFGKTLLLLAFYLAIVIQFAGLHYDPRAQLPTAADRAAGDSLLERLARIDGDIFAPAHGFLATAAGKPSHAHGMAFHDTMSWSGEELATKMRREVEHAISVQRFGAIVTDSRWDALTGWGMQRLLGRFYRRQGGLIYERQDVFWPRTGMPTRPDSIWIRRRPELDGER
jgi:hypothetical protein